MSRLRNIKKLEGFIAKYADEPDIYILMQQVANLIRPRKQRNFGFHKDDLDLFVDPKKVKLTNRSAYPGMKFGSLFFDEISKSDFIRKLRENV